MANEAKTPDPFDRLMGALDGLPDVVRTKASVTRSVPPLGVGGAQLYVVQTFRQKDQGDTIFLEHVSESGTLRIAIPAAVANVIARQRDQLSTRVRSLSAKAAMKERMDGGEVLGFRKHQVK